MVDVKLFNDTNDDIEASARKRPTVAPS